MTSDEHRAQCIEAMYRRARHHPAAMWHSDAACKEAMADILDSLHGVAFVDPTEATEEMVRAALWNVVVGVCGNYSAIWSAMAAAGNLTNPPEPLVITRAIDPLTAGMFSPPETKP